MQNLLVVTFIVVTQFTFSLNGIATPLDFSSLRNPNHEHPIHTFASINLRSDSKNLHPRNRPINAIPEAYFLDISADPVSGLIEGVSKIAFRLKDPFKPLVSFDAKNMQINSVINQQGDYLSFDYDGSILRIHLNPNNPEKIHRTVSINYRAQKSQHYFLTAPDASSPNRSISSYTFTQPEGSQHWFPCIDRPNAKAILDVKISTPASYKALSNGILLGNKQLGVTSNFHYRMDFPIAPYLVSLAVGDFTVFDLGTFHKKPLKLWAPPALARSALKAVSNTKQMMKVIGEFTGVSYPFASYSQSVAQAWSSSMEHQSATTMGGWRIRGDLSGEGVVAHELAHQWFGDWVTCESWKEMWLNEGFASYLPFVYFSKTEKTSNAMDYHLWWREGYFSEAKRYARALSSPNNRMENIFDSHSYEKGALVIHLMRSITNRLPMAKNHKTELFSKALKIYLENKGGGNVSNSHLQAALEQASNRSWQIFFDQWVRSKGHPIISAKIEFEDNSLVGNIEQIQATRLKNKWNVFSFPLDIEVFGVDGQRSVYTVDIYDAKQRFELSLDFEPVAYNLDPELIVPAEIQFDGQLAQLHSNWLEVFKSAPSAYSRMMALKRLFKEKPSKKQFKVYQEIILAETSPYIKAESLALLSQFKESYSIIEKIITHLEQLSPAELDLSVRRAIAHGKVWLVKHGQIPASSKQILSWQKEFMETPYTSEREAILDKLTHANLKIAQEFAVQRLQESKLVTKDRAHLIDVLTKNPSIVSKDFIQQMIKSCSYHWFKRIIANLKTARYQDENLSKYLIDRAETCRYDYEMIYSMKLLGGQSKSINSVCPYLLSFKERDLSDRVYASEIRDAANNASVELHCSSGH
ncbi:MAG: M1 family metallopeptidase [Oligoflexales bacterium]